MKPTDLDKKFDEGKEDILEYFDVSTAERCNLNLKKVNVDMPIWMVKGLDEEAERLGIARQAVIKTWLAERLKHHLN